MIDFKKFTTQKKKANKNGDKNRIKKVIRMFFK